MASSRDYEVVIIGGGPAGSTAARLLARWGHSVRLLTRPPAYAIAESLPPSCRKLFAELGILDAIDAAGFCRGRGNTVWWGDLQGRSEDFPDGVAGYQVERQRFDALLLDLAAAAGAEVDRDCTVREAADAGAGGGGGGGAWILDCSGRAGVIARRGFRKDEKGRATLAVVAAFRRASWNLPDESHTLVESYHDGWAWSIPTSATVRHVAMMVDPELTGLARDRPVDQLFQFELAKTVRFRALLQGAEQLSPARGLGASPYTAEQFAGPGFLLVGDAASFIDPLSSSGVKKALASAWLAAIVVHTGLTKPEMRDPALELYQAREREMYASYSRLAARYFAQGAGAHDHPFWTARSEDDSSNPLGSAAAADPLALRDDPGVLAAFASLRQSPAIALQAAAGVRIVKKAAVAGNEVVLEDRLVSSWAPEGIRFLRNVDLPRLIALAPHHSQVPDLFEAYHRAGPPVALPDFLGALSVLLARGTLENSV